MLEYKWKIRDNSEIIKLQLREQMPHIVKSFTAFSNYCLITSENAWFPAKICFSRIAINCAKISICQGVPSLNSWTKERLLSTTFTANDKGEIRVYVFLKK